MRRGRTSKTGSENSSFWLSFSDMMSVLVLIFIFVIFSMMFTLNEQEEKYEQAREEYLIAQARAEASEKSEADMLILLCEAEEKLKLAQAQADEAEEKLSEIVIVLDQTRQELDTAAASLSESQNQLSIVSSQLSEKNTIIINLQSENATLSNEYALLLQEKQMLESNYISVTDEIAALEALIAQKRAEADELTAQYAALLAASEEGNALAAQYQSEIAFYKQELAETQAQLEMTLGVKAQIIRQLSVTLKSHNINVDVDQQTGAIALPGAMLFDSGKTELKDGGKRYLDEFLPVYLSVLLSDEFKPYISEIVIEGHTDSTGKAGTDSYLYNLALSQERALSVANYILDTGYMRRTLNLSTADADCFKRLVSASGRSYSALKYNSDGTENKEASRRVEIKFSLIDEESVAATKQLIGN